MNLRTKLLCYTAAVMLSTSAAFAAIDGNALADSYLADGYTYVEVKVGPTQTKVEAIKGTTKVEVIYDNETQEVITSEQSTVEADENTPTGKEVKTVGHDFEGDGKGHDGADEDHKGDKGDKGGKDDDGDDHDEGDDHDGDHDSDHDGGHDGDHDGDHGGEGGGGKG